MGRFPVPVSFWSCTDTGITCTLWITIFKQPDGIWTAGVSFINTGLDSEQKEHEFSWGVAKEWDLKSTTETSAKAEAETFTRNLLSDLLALMTPPPVV